MRLILAVIRTIHAWAGAALSLLLIVLGLTGALLVFKNDWIRLTVPEARAAVSPTPQMLGAAAEAAERSFGEHVHHIVFASQNLGVHQVFLHGERYAYLAGDGKTLAVWQGAGRPEEWVYELHHFLLAGDTGMRVAGFAALAAALLALTGLIVWTPAWRASRLRLWPRSARRGDLLATHRNIGLIFAIPILVFCLTGAGMIFYKTTATWLDKAFPGAEADNFFPPADPGKIDWPKALAGAQAAFPKARLRVAVWPAFAASPAEIRMKQPGEWTPDGQTKVLIDPFNSQVLGVIDPLKAGRGQQLNGAIYPIHTAAVGGRFYDAAAFLSGLAMAGLGVLGLWSFIVKPRRQKRSAATR